MRSSTYVFCVLVRPISGAESSYFDITFKTQKMRAITQTQTNNIFEQYALKTRLSLLAYNNHQNFTYCGKCVTQWEEITTVRFNEKLKQLEAVITIKSRNGYSWPLSPNGSKEYIRFFIDWNETGNYEDAGLTSFLIHNDHVINVSQSPQQYIVRFNLYTNKNLHAKKQAATVKIRAVLSWNILPSSNPNELPVFGNYIDGHVKIAA